MKTKTFFCLCLILGIGLTQVSAQNNTGKQRDNRNDNGTGTIITNNWPVDGIYFVYPISCSNGKIDNIVGTILFGHGSDFYKNGVLIRANGHVHGEAQSTYLPYETFKVSEIDLNDVSAMTTNWHFNLIGSNGSHYIGDITWNWGVDPIIVTVNKIVCLEKK